MKQTNLSEIFHWLTPKERFEIDKAVNSPFFNQREDVLKLWQLLQKEQPLPEKETLFVALYGDDLSFHQQKIYTATTILWALMERVLCILENEKDDATQKLNIAQWYRKRTLNKHFSSNITETQLILDKKGLKDAHFYATQFKIAFENYENDIANRSTDLNLQPLNDALDVSFMIEKLKTTCLLFSQQAVLKVNYDFGLLSAILTYIENHQGLLEKPALATYYYCYLLQTQPQEMNHFDTFKQLIITHHSVFNEIDNRALYLLGVNYCIKKHNTGLEKYAYEGLELFKKALKDNFLLENGVISRVAFHNIVAWALVAKEHDWAAQFINDYRNNLERTYRDSMYSFCMAKLEYSRKNYNAALLLLQKAEYRDILLGLAAKVILLKIYYETDEIEVLEAHLNSLKAYIVRKRVLGYHKKNYQNVISYTRKLIAISSNAHEINTLREAIQNETVLTEKEWFLAQL